MKYIPSIAFEEMSDSAKGVTAAKVRGRKYIRNRGYGGGFKTSAQAAVKSIFKQLSQSWKSLTNAQILAWNALANTQKGKNVLGTASKNISVSPFIIGTFVMVDKRISMSALPLASLNNPTTSGFSMKLISIKLLKVLPNSRME